jgi:hypothetical protein
MQFLTIGLNNLGFFARAAACDGPKGQSSANARRQRQNGFEQQDF